MRFDQSMALAVMVAMLLLGGTSLGVVSSVPAARAQEITVGYPAVVNADSLVVRQAPGLNAAVVASLPDGTDVLVIDGPVVADGYDWFLLAQGEETLGWSVQGFVQEPSALRAPVSLVPAAETVWKVTAPFVYVRAEASAESAIARIVTVGTQLPQDGVGVEVDGDRWVPVEGGWIGGPGGGPSAGVSLALYPLYVSADALNVRAAPNLSGTVVAVLAYGDTVNVFGSFRDQAGRVWNAVDAEGTLWISADWVTVSLDDARPTGSLRSMPVG